MSLETRLERIERLLIGDANAPGVLSRLEVIQTLLTQHLDQTKPPARSVIVGAIYGAIAGGVVAVLLRAVG